MTRVILGVIGVMIFAASCTQRTVCPAYQSAFIYDKDQLRKKFSYFLNDTTPKVYTASKTKYLIAEPVSYQKKVRSLNTVVMEEVYVEVPDSISGKGDQVSEAALDSAARSIIDSTFIVDIPAADTVQAVEDSTYVISKDREIRVLKYNMPDSLVFDSTAQKYVRQKPQYYVDEIGFNIEQDNYMWYLRKSLVLPDVRLAKIQDGGAATRTESKATKKKGFFGFFKNLFKKKKDIDSAEFDLKPVNPDEFDFIDTTAVDDPEFIEQSEEQTKILPNEHDPNQNDQDPAQNDRSRKKKKKATKKKKEQPQPPVKKEEDEDDGF